MQEDTITAPRSAQSEVVDLIEYLEIVLRRKKMIMVTTITAAIISAVVSLLLPKSYESTAKILPPQQDQGAMSLMIGQLSGGSGLAGLAGGLLGAATSADFYATVLESDDIKDTIIDRFKLMQVYDKDERVAMYKTMEKIVEIKAGKKDGVITITVEDEEPKRAAAIAGAYVDELAKMVAVLSATGASVNRVFLEGRLAKAKADLVRAENDLKAFQSRSKAIDVPEQAKASIEAIAMLRAQLVTQETQLSAVRSRFTDSTQEAMDLKATISNIKRQIAHMEGQGSGSSILSAGSVPELGQQYVRLMREFKIQETIVELLTKQYELAKLSEAKDVSNVQVIQKPHVPDKKVKPKRILIVLGTTLMAFLCSISTAMLQHYRCTMPHSERQKWFRIRNALTGKNDQSVNS